MLTVHQKTKLIETHERLTQETLVTGRMFFPLEALKRTRVYSLAI